MSAATIKKSWQVAQNGGWAETFNFYLGSTATPDDLDGCTAQLNLNQPGSATVEPLSYNSADATPYLTLTVGSVSLAIPQSVTAAWASGQYDVQLRVIPASGGVDRYNLIGPGRLNVVAAP
jgi:hypothetical protein